MLDPRVTGGRAAGPVWPGAPAQWREDQRLEFKIPIFSVQFVPHCHNLSEQYWLQVGCAKFNLICTNVGGGGLFGTTKRFLQYCLTTIVTLVYFCSQGYTGMETDVDIWFTSTFGVKRNKFLTLSPEACVSSRAKRTGESLESPEQWPGQPRTSCLEWDIDNWLEVR